MTIHEAYGKLQEELLASQVAHEKTLELLRSILRGQIALNRITVYGDGRWEVAAEADALAWKVKHDYLQTVLKDVTEGRLDGRLVKVSDDGVSIEPQPLNLPTLIASE